jgi:hypothetical protein
MAAIKRFFNTLWSESTDPDTLSEAFITAFLRTNDH